jgi:bifunctional UDP-N-acetylglucosamine pyrophosphorylase/glucosamine-1-phosphate N-acetyltransferase
MVARVVGAIREAGVRRIIVVVGHRADDVKAALGPDMEYVHQGEQLGTGHALLCANSALAGYEGVILVANADAPLVSDGELTGLLAHHMQTGAAATILTASVEKPGSLGRVIRSPDGYVRAIVEARDAAPEVLALREVNIGVYCFAAPGVFQALGAIRSRNAKGEYYLTDVIAILDDHGERVEGIRLHASHNAIGVDSREDLSRAQRLLAPHQEG